MRQDAGCDVAVTYDIGEKMCFAHCHAHTGVMLNVQEVHMQMVVAWLIVNEHPQLVRSYFMPAHDCLHRDDTCSGSHVMGARSNNITSSPPISQF